MLLCKCLSLILTNRTDLTKQCNYLTVKGWLLCLYLLVLSPSRHKWSPDLLTFDGCSQCPTTSTHSSRELKPANLLWKLSLFLTVYFSFSRPKILSLLTSFFLRLNGLLQYRMLLLSWWETERGDMLDFSPRAPPAYWHLICPGSSQSLSVTQMSTPSSSHLFSVINFTKTTWIKFFRVELNDINPCLIFVESISHKMRITTYLTPHTSHLTPAVWDFFW